MKNVLSVVLIALSALVLSGCAGTTQAPSVQVKSVKEHNQEVVAPVNTQSRIEIIKAKLSSFAEKDLEKINNFVDSLWAVKADSNKEIMVMVVEKDMEFPPLLDEIMSKHPKLNSLPRDPSTLVVVESPRAPGVRNVFIRVPASAMGDQDDVFAWMPDATEWMKFIDIKANKLEGKEPQVAYLILFAKANERLNPELIDPVKGGANLPPEKQEWDWNNMPHPKTLGNKWMLVPLATVRGQLTVFFN